MGEVGLNHFQETRIHSKCLDGSQENYEFEDSLGIVNSWLSKATLSGEEDISNEFSNLEGDSSSPRET